MSEFGIPLKFGLIGGSQSLVEKTELILKNRFNAEVVFAINGFPETWSKGQRLLISAKVDILFVGPSDLTLGLGKFGQLDDPEVRAILISVVAACQHHGKVAAIPCAPEQVQGYQEMGFRFFNVISDYRCVFHGLKAARAAVVAKGAGECPGCHSAAVAGCLAECGERNGER